MKAEYELAEPVNNTNEWAPIAALLGGDTMKWLAMAFLGLVLIIFIGIAFIFFGRIIFALGFLALDVYLTIAIMHAAPKMDKKYVLGIFFGILAFALVVLVWH